MGVLIGKLLTDRECCCRNMANSAACKLCGHCEEACLQGAKTEIFGLGKT